MTNTALFLKAAEKCERSEENIASLLGISVEAYKAKIYGKAEFTASEISVLITVFGLDCETEVAKSIFFA